MSWLCFGDYEIRGRNYADDSNKELWRSVQEALQLLANSELILSSGGDIFYWRATRLGVATRANGKDAVRQRIKDQTGL